MSKTEDALVGALQRVDAIEFARTGGFDFRGYAQAILAEEPRLVLRPSGSEADAELDYQLNRFRSLMGEGPRTIEGMSINDLRRSYLDEL